ncbi:MAG: HIT family protein [Ignavibacteriae bacterium]|nr:HIT family protein [Ignavibacteriota bacterium]
MKTNQVIECEFCKIIRGEAPAEILYKDQHVIAILDIKPIHYGHILVIPRTHSATFLEVPEDQLANIIKVTKIVSEALVDALKPPGFNIFSNNGKAAGQSVFHFHFHITPRYSDDNIRFVLKLKKYQNDAMALYANRIRQCINSHHMLEVH